MPVAALALAVVALASQPNPAKLVLRPSSVAPGYLMVQPPDGKGKAQRTLDVCGTKNYPSEALRTARLQVDYGKPKAQLLLSNEVVVYKDGGAAQAMREVAEHAKNCPAKPIAFEGQPPLRYTYTRLADSKLLHGALAYRMEVSGTVKGKRVHGVHFLIYQRLGNVLSGVYSYASSKVSPAAQERFALHAAEASAKILRQGSQGGGTPA
jgi:hypothetical protein